MREPLVLHLNCGRWHMRLFSGRESGGKKAGGGWGAAQGGCGPRERIARMEARLALLDRQDESAPSSFCHKMTRVLTFDWDNCDSVAHESQGNALRHPCRRHPIVANVSAVVP